MNPGKSSARTSRKRIQKVSRCILRGCDVLMGYSKDEHMDFVAYARDLAASLRQTIFTDQVSGCKAWLVSGYSFVMQVHHEFQSRVATFKLLEEHINENIVKVCPICFEWLSAV